LSKRRRRVSREAHSSTSSNDMENKVSAVAVVDKKNNFKYKLEYLQVQPVSHWVHEMQ
jgi:hypothetical protein